MVSQRSAVNRLMAFPSWMYRDPQKARMTSERYDKGCFNCRYNKHNGKKWGCILNHVIWPDGDDQSCKDRKAVKRQEDI